MKKALNIHGLNPETFAKRINYMRSKTAEFSENVENLRVYISGGNSKTGAAVPSVSLRPVLDCGNCASCSGLCYDIRRDCMYPNVMDTRANNAAIFASDPGRYFNEISTFCKTAVAFRWHVGGDIVNMSYLLGMVKVARENRHCKFLCFTKRFDLVNEFLSHHRKPSNLQIIFSGWVGLDVPNPYNLPMSHPVFSDGRTSAPDGAKWCGGNCTECLINRAGCWTLKKNESVIFAAH